MKYIYLILLLSFTTLITQAKELCEGEYESILHDSSSGINQNSLSHMEADKKGYNITLNQDATKIVITQNGKKEIYIKDEKNN